MNYAISILLIGMIANIIILNSELNINFYNKKQISKVLSFFIKGFALVYILVVGYSLVEFVFNSLFK